MAKVKKKRSTKGTISIFNRNGILYLRWSYESKRFILSTHLADTPNNRIKAKEVIRKIEVDIFNDVFDITLDKYRPVKKIAVKTIDQFQRYIDYRLKSGTSGQAIASKYKPLLSNLERFGKDVEDEKTAREFMDLLRSRQQPLCANQNLTLLKGFFAWLKIESNPFENISPLKSSKVEKIPFTSEEIKSILATAKLHSLYSNYHDFIFTLFYLGLRPSEAIGLRWKHIDLIKGEITISESLSRSVSGKSSGLNRQRKDTKTGNVRKLDLVPSLKDLLQGRKSHDANPDDLVFTAKKGGVINDNVFSQKVWRRLLSDAGVEYRCPYIIRHSFASHLIEGGATIPQTAKMLGHQSNRMVTETYAHMVTRPKMPEF